MHLVLLLSGLLAQAPAAPAAFPNVDRSLQLPSGLKLTGKPMAARRWTDKLGENLLVVTETARVGEASGGTKHLYGYQFLRAGQGWKQLWRIRDAVIDCEFDLELALAADSLSVTDLDGDGTAETAFAYTKTCTSDVSPSDLKVLMHEGDRKYALRGTTRVQSGENEYAGGDRKPDAALAAAPKPFLSHAQRLFDAAGGK